MENIETPLQIINKLGLHARASSVLVSLASQFDSEILLFKNEQMANAKSIMGVMMLAASQGTTLTLQAKGTDAKQATQAILALVENRFGEKE